MVSRLQAAWAVMPQSKRTKLIVAVVLGAAACAAVSWWGTRTEWKTLYSGMEARDLQQVESELAAASIPYQVTADGSGVQVSAELVDKARMEIAAKGMPQSGRMGFELFDKPNWVGSEFDEKVNFQRALEGELEHTIATIGSVRSARVHLVLPKESLFSNQQQPAKASVVMKLKRSTLGREEIESIRNLVAGAVEGLAPEQVTLVDADGRASFNTPGHSQLTSSEEQSLADKLVAMLEPLAGRENVRATVNIAYDESSQESTDEIVDPSQVVALQSQKSVQQSGGTAKAAGIPGTASNTPSGADAQGKAQLPVFPSAGAQPQVSSEESSTFAVTKHTKHQESGPGRVARVTAAVLINDRAVVEGSGKTQHVGWRPRTNDEMHRLEELAQAAVGFDKQRGDSVVLQNIGFSANAPEPVAAGFEKATDEVKSLLRSQPGLLRTLGAGMVAMLLVMLVVRPVAKQALVVMQEYKALPAPAMSERNAAVDGGNSPLQLSEGVPHAADASEIQAKAARRAAAAIDPDGVLEYVSTYVRRDPQQSTRLLEAWIGSKELA
jgi:flagellar M-ring protein FliF